MAGQFPCQKETPRGAGEEGEDDVKIVALNQGEAEEGENFEYQ